jgi:hypothetical protein
METKQFTQEEINQIKELQTNYQQIGLELVQAKLAIIQIKQQLTEYEQQETSLIDKISTINKQEQEFVAQLQQKYGKGELDLSTGVFTPIS